MCNLITNLGDMTRLYTLRNIIPLLVVLIFTACSSATSQYNADLKSISSEDKYSEYTQIGEIQSSEKGHTVYLMSKK